VHCSGVDITAVVVTYQSERWIRGCLSSLRAEAPPATEIVVVDNASTDATLAVAREGAPEAIVDALPVNTGFAAAANCGAARASGRYLLFLNPDAELRAGAVQALLGHLEAHPTVAAAGPRLCYPDGTPQDAAFTYPSLLMTWLEFFPRPGRLLHSRLNGRLPSLDGCPIAVDYPLGACMLVRRSAWEQVGPFDEGFFMYCEEVDWCMRARQRGWTITHVPAALVAHAGGASSEQVRPASLLHLYESRRRLHRKHRPTWFRVLARFLTCVGLAQERRRILRGRTNTPQREALVAAVERAAHLAA
jgi:hypothetical protein